MEQGLKLSNFLYTLEDFDSEIKIMTDYWKIEKQWSVFMNRYRNEGHYFSESYIDRPEKTVELLFEMLEFVLDNFRYFKFVFSYTAEERNAICPRLTIVNQDSIFEKLIEDYDLYYEDEDEYEDDENDWHFFNVKKWLVEKYGLENIYSGSADWGGIPVWSVGPQKDKFTGYFVGIDIDNDNNVFFMKREFDDINEENIDTDYFNADSKPYLDKLFKYVEEFGFEYN